MNDVKFDKMLDARGLACPMPLVKARQEINQLQAGQVLKVLSTDRGSFKDFQGWAQAVKTIELVAQQTDAIDGQQIFVHFVKKAG